jgi:hypothetical protein
MTELFIVIDGFSYATIGVYDDLNKAKMNGSVATHNNYKVMRYMLNKACTYAITTVYQSFGNIDEEESLYCELDENEEELVCSEEGEIEEER